MLIHTIILLTIPILAICQYTKIQYRTIYSTITDIANCRSATNIIFTTADGKLNYWIAYNEMDQYDIPVSTVHRL